MSLDRTRRPRLLWVLAISIAVFATIWLISPWLYLGGLRVENARLTDAPSADPGPLAGLASKRVVVSFTTAQDLQAYRKKWRLPFIQAGITACNDRSLGTNDAVVTQAGGYLADQGRVRPLGHTPGSAPDRYTYQVTFNNVLVSTGDNHEGRLVPASTVPGGLCFRLHGATLFSGSVRSARIPLTLQGG
ncbi:hypothetical protein ACSBM8_01650 [Sphingomonas sp. ASY06-1R]|jgi:hypothetical protein|uniref:hypothetical protein n=1 Tax=Sphingomonas sp. ASY06-1R TaxID=3445771 RepID=UPI003FA256EC